MELMTVRDYAAHVRSSESTIRNMCRQGILPSVKIGVGWRIDVERADDYFRKAMTLREAKTTSGSLPKQNYLEVICEKLKNLN